MLPEAMALLPSDSEQVECGRHGWQPIIRKATHREVIQGILGIELPDSDPDEPPF